MFYKLDTAKSDIPYFVNFDTVELVKPLDRENWFEIQFVSGYILRVETKSILTVLDEIYAQKHTK